MWCCSSLCASGLVCHFSPFFPSSSQFLYTMEQDSKQYKSFLCPYLSLNLSIGIGTHSALECDPLQNNSSLRTRSQAAVYKTSLPQPQWYMFLMLTQLMELILESWWHPALPCNENGNYLPLHTKPPPLLPVDATNDNAWHPFDNRLAFDFANFQFAELQASESRINCALDLWMAANIKAGGDERVVFCRGNVCYDWCYPSW